MKTASSGIEIQENEISFRNRDYFLGWQCRVREQIMRRENGRPTKGIRPKVLLGDPVIHPVRLLQDPNFPGNPQPEPNIHLASMDYYYQ